MSTVSVESKRETALHSDPGYAELLALISGMPESARPEASAYCDELTKHQAWGLPFSGYANAAGYGYVYEPTTSVAQDGWNAHRAFLKLDPDAQTLVVFEGLHGTHDIDWESARNFLKHERGIIIHGNWPY